MVDSNDETQTNDTSDEIRTRYLKNLKKEKRESLVFRTETRLKYKNTINDTSSERRTEMDCTNDEERPAAKEVIIERRHQTRRYRKRRNQRKERHQQEITTSRH